MRRARLLTVLASLALLGMASSAPAPDSTLALLRPAARSDRSHRVEHAGPTRCAAPCVPAAWQVPVWVAVDLPFLERPAKRPRAHPRGR